MSNNYDKMMAIRNFCVRHDYFTGGTNEQYEKMFKLAESGASIEQVAWVVWFCSYRVSAEEVLSNMRKEIGNVFK